MHPWYLGVRLILVDCVQAIIQAPDYRHTDKYLGLVLVIFCVQSIISLIIRIFARLSLFVGIFGGDFQGRCIPTRHLFLKMLISISDQMKKKKKEEKTNKKKKIKNEIDVEKILNIFGIKWETGCSWLCLYFALLNTICLITSLHYIFTL